MALFKKFAAIIGLSVSFPGTTLGATATSTLAVSITFQASCQISGAGPLSFGTQGVLSAAVTATATVSVQCSNSTPYSIGLNAGTASNGTTTTRYLTSGAQSVSYKIYQDSSRTTNWGNTAGVDTVSQVGNGAVQTTTLYGTVPIQNTPSPGSYSDTVTITVTY